MANWPAASSQTLSSVSNQATPVRNGKRRHEYDDDETENSGRPGRDEAMDRSPTPERPKRAAPKRARTNPMATHSKDNKAPGGEGSDANDVDVGVLLGAFYSFSRISQIV